MNELSTFPKCNGWRTLWIMEMIEKISRLIEERRLTQSGVERACHLAGNRISIWKAGTGEPTARQILRIADVLKTDVRYLIDDDMNEPPGPAVSLTEDEAEILKIARLVGYPEALARLVKAETTQAPPDSVRTRPIGPLPIGVITSVPFDGDDIHKPSSKPKTPTR